MPLIARTNVFVSYSHHDESFLAELLAHLKPFERSGAVSKWSDKDAAAGSHQLVELQRALLTTRVAVLLVSASFLASDFIHQHELGPLLKEAETGGVRILWVHVRACSWRETPLKNYQAAISPATPLAEMKAERDQAWVKVCASIGEALDSDSRAALRKLVQAVLLTSSDFDAFCLDHFPEVYRHFSREVDRGGKLDLLLALGDAAELRRCLGEAYPYRVNDFHRQQGGLRPKEHHRLDAALRLKELLRKRAVLLEYNSDSTRIDGEIDRERKSLRQGPRVKKGEVLSERYQLVQKINQGAYGEIWLGHDLNLDTDIAVKILHGKWNDREEIVNRFAEVAKQVASISHPHVISVLGPVSEWEEFHYYVMEYLAGGDLHQAVLRDRDKRKKRDFLGRLCEVGSALTSLHGKGLVHRDIKPQNILLDAHGAAKISDFDLLGGDVLKRTTETGEARGTFLYAAPEQFGNAAHADARADIHALGRTAIFIIYGDDLPVQAGDDRIRFVESLAIATNLKKILLRATESDPAKRYPTVAEFCTDLESALTSPAALSAAPQVVPEEKTIDRPIDLVIALSPIPDVDEPITIRNVAEEPSADALDAWIQPPPQAPDIISTPQSTSLLNPNYKIIIALLILIFPGYFIFNLTTKPKANLPDLGAIFVEPAKPAEQIPPDLAVAPVTANRAEQILPDLAVVPDLSVKNPEIKTTTPMKKNTPKTDLSALDQAIPELELCLSTNKEDDTTKMKVIFKISKNKTEAFVRGGKWFNPQCMEKILNKIKFPSVINERFFTAEYSFPKHNVYSVRIIKSP